MTLSISKRKQYFLLAFACCALAAVLFIGLGINRCFAEAAAECGGQFKSATASWGLFCDYSC